MNNKQKQFLLNNVTKMNMWLEPKKNTKQNAQETKIPIDLSIKKIKLELKKQGSKGNKMQAVEGIVNSIILNNIN